MRRRGNGCWLQAGVATILCFGCNSGPAKSAAEVGQGRDTRVVHEECNVSAANAERLDANADGKAEVTIVKGKSGRPACQAVDLNGDGRVDVWSYYDDAGGLRRREYDFDRDGTIEQITVYAAGVPVSSERATLLANRLDTWDYYKSGVLARTERDSDADARVDQWWEYPKVGCPLIHTDANQDGKPDPGTTVDYCKETGYVPPDRQYYRQATGPDFTKPMGTPTEVENKPSDAPQGGTAPAKPETK